jgi:predicted ATPase
VIDVPLTRYRPADNPFASHRVKIYAYWDLEVDAEDLLRHLDRLGGRGAIIGPKGSGKTTLLEELESWMTGRVKWVRIPGSDPHPLKTALEQLDQPVTESDTLLIDGSEQLAALPWRRFILASLRARRIVATLHQPGRFPTLFKCAPNPDILSDLVHYLAPDDAVILEPHLPDLFRRHDGNIRLCFRELYDAYAGRAPAEERVDRACRP